MADLDISIFNNNRFQITQYFGQNPALYKPLGLKYHMGVDIIGLDGDWDIEAVYSGTILFANWKRGGYGNVVVLLTDAIPEFGNKQFVVKYMHLEAMDVTKGQRVKMLDRVGVIGNTGNSTGRHLHFEVSPYTSNWWQSRNCFDPLPWLNVIDDAFKAIGSVKNKPNRPKLELDKTPTESPAEKNKDQLTMSERKAYEEKIKALENENKELGNQIKSYKEEFQHLKDDDKQKLGTFEKLKDQIESLKTKNIQLQGALEEELEIQKSQNARQAELNSVQKKEIEVAQGLINQSKPIYRSKKAQAGGGVIATIVTAFPFMSTYFSTMRDAGVDSNWSVAFIAVGLLSIVGVGIAYIVSQGGIDKIKYSKQLEIGERMFKDAAANVINTQIDKNTNGIINSTLKDIVQEKLN